MGFELRALQFRNIAAATVVDAVATIDETSFVDLLVSLLFGVFDAS